MRRNNKKILQIFNDRLILMFVGISFLFCILIFKFYYLQIIEHDKYSTGLRASVERQIEIPATRGLIYDRYGRPLATNVPTNVLKVDQQIKMDKKQLNNVLLNVANILTANGDDYIDEIPISKEPPFEFSQGTNTVKQFIYAIPYDDEEHRQQLMGYNAQQLFEYLRGDEVFQVDSQINDKDARKVIALRFEIYKYAYRKYNLVTIANGISPQTVAQIEERYNEFPGVVVDVEPIRHYPEGETLGNVIGYTRAITDKQLEQMQGMGYDKNDVVGQVGVEQTMENDLRGEKGLEKVEVDDVGRRVHTIETEEATKGNDVFLTIDLDLQKAAYQSVEKRLSEALIQRLQGGTRTVKSVRAREVLCSMVESNQLLIEKMKVAPSGSKQKEIYDRLVSEYNNIDPLVRGDLTLKGLLVEWLNEEPSLVTDKEILLALHEQGSVKLSTAQVESFKNNKYGNTEYILIEQLQNGTLKPSQMAIDPFSGSAIVVDVNTGEVLALVGYPSFDGNEMITNFNRYYSMLFDGMDKRSMLWNRALKTAKAPGSIFKMITAAAGLEEGAISPDTTIYDSGAFTKVGEPYPRCWTHVNSGGGHGNVDINRAFEVSCNYFFYETAFRLGENSKNPYAGIDTLTEYVKKFGLDQKTGIELDETYPNISTPKNLVERQMSEVLRKLRGLEGDPKLTYIEELRQALEKDMYPYGDSNATEMDDRIDYLIQYEVKRNLEPQLQKAFKANIDHLISVSLENMQSQLQMNLSPMVEDIVETTLADDSVRSLKAKTKDNLMRHIDNMLGDEVTKIINESISTININKIIDAYEHAYTTLYRREVRKNSDPQLVSALQEKINKLDTEKEYYKQYISKKVEENLVETLSNQMLKGVDLEWSNAITVRTAIGQGNNAFTPVQLARYVAAVANKKEVFDLRVVRGMFDAKDDEVYEETEAKKLKNLEISEGTMDLIHKSMLRVTEGSSGTARDVFDDLPFDVPAKTGTAQEGSHEHSWFAGFAPYDNPQIAIITTIYNSDGLGKYGTLMAKDILESYFRLKEQPDKVTLDNMFIK